jgi:hypothetical protein
MRTTLLRHCYATCFLILSALTSNAQEPPRCFTDTFDDAASLENWRIGSGQGEITDDGRIRLKGADLVAANFRQPGGDDWAYEDFHFCVDMEYVNSTSDDNGVFARGQAGFASYLMFLNNGSELQIMRIPQGGGFTIIGRARISKLPGDWLRYEFIGKGAELTGRVYSLDDPTTPLAEVNVTDDTYASGSVGFVKINGPAPLEFDNFRVLDPDDPDGCDKPEPEPPVCFTDTFDDTASLKNWRIGEGGSAEITEEGTIRLTGGNIVPARFQNSVGGDYIYEDFHFSVEMEYKNTTASTSGRK